MKKYMMILAALMVSAAPAYVAFQAHAEDAAAPAEAAPAAEVEVKEATLADGTKVLIKGEEVFVVGEDGAETAAPDGTHTLSDGTTITTAGGKVVPAEAPAEEAPAAQ